MSGTVKAQKGEMFQRGERVFLPGSSGAPSRLAAEAFAAPGLDLTTSYIPGVNVIPDHGMAGGGHCTGMFMQPGMAQAQRAGSFRHLPLSYAATLKYFEAQAPFDTCLAQMTPPDAAGVCSLGPAAEFTPGIMRRAGRVIAVINPAVPRLAHAPLWRLADCALVLEDDASLVSYDPGAPDADALDIAAHAASMVPDGAVLQLGLGKVPAAIYGRLGSHRGLKFHTGLLTGGIMGLADQGALAKNFAHKTTVILGTEALYAWAAGRTDIHVMGCEYIHAPEVLAAIEGLIAVNSALEVDLFGQCNLEFANGRAISGAGGAPDFAHAARRSKGGISIVAMPARFGAGKGSRIKPVLGQDAIVSLPRTDVDVVITEIGIADLRGKSVHERAEALIEIAAPAFRPALMEAWAVIQRRL
jgi:acyl-CoA hydrolase